MHKQIVLGQGVTTSALGKSESSIIGCHRTRQMSSPTYAYPEEIRGDPYARIPYTIIRTLPERAVQNVDAQCVQYGVWNRYSKMWYSQSEN